MLFSKRTNRKDKENYIVNAIWHKLDNINIQPVTQQCVVLGNGNHALIDLYFPQIKYGVECDEEYHKNNTFQDLERTKSIEKALSGVNIDRDFKLFRIDATASLDDINNNIDKAVKEIKQRIEELSEPLVWKSVDDRIEDAIKSGILSVSDQIPFHKHADVGPCFCRNPNEWLRSYFSINDEYQLWFPILAIEMNREVKSPSNSGWINVLASDWSHITEYYTGLNIVKKDNQQEKKRITFAKSKDVYGRTAYRFIGVFIYDHIDNDGHRVYNRIAESLDLTQFKNG